MKLDPGIYIAMHSVLSLKPSVTKKAVAAAADETRRRNGTRAHGGLPMVTKTGSAAVASGTVRIATATAELEGLSSAQHDGDRGTRRPAWQLAEPAPFRLPIDSDPAGAGAGRTKPRARGACRSAAAVAAGRALRRRHRRLEARTRLGWRAI